MKNLKKIYILLLFFLFSSYSYCLNFDYTIQDNCMTFTSPDDDEYYIDYSSDAISMSAYKSISLYYPYFLKFIKGSILDYGAYQYESTSSSSGLYITYKKLYYYWWGYIYTELAKNTSTGIFTRGQAWFYFYSNDIMNDLFPGYFDSNCYAEYSNYELILNKTDLYDTSLVSANIIDILYLDDRDFDGDGITNYQELSYCGHPTNYTAGLKDATTDSDGDGLPDLFEDILGTDSSSTTTFYTISHLYNQYYLNAYTSDKKKLNDLLVIYAYVSGVDDVSTVTASELETILKSTDSDGDCVNNLEEYYLGTNAMLQDWYDDSYYSSSLLGTGQYLTDTDSDGWSDLFEDKMNLDKNSEEVSYDTSDYYNYIASTATGSSSSSSSSLTGSNLDDLLASFDTDTENPLYTLDLEIPTQSDVTLADGDNSQLGSIDSNTIYTNTLLTTQLEQINSLGNLSSVNTNTTNSILESINSNLATGFTGLSGTIIDSSSDSDSSDSDLSLIESLLATQLSTLDDFTTTDEKETSISTDKYSDEYDTISTLLSSKFGFDKLAGAFDGYESTSFPNWSIEVPCGLNISSMSFDSLTLELNLYQISEYSFVKFFRSLLYYVLVFLLCFAFIRILTNY